MCTPLIHYTILNDPEVNDSVTFTMTSIRTRQIIRYRATATLRRPQNKQYSASK